MLADGPKKNARKTVAVQKHDGPPPLRPSNLPQGVTVRPNKRAGVDVAIGSTETQNVFKKLAGSDNHDFNSVTFRQTLATFWMAGCKTAEETNRAIAAVAAALRAFKPEDEIEGMLASQAVAMHFGAMECFRRSMLPEQPSDIASKLRKDGANLARGMTDMLDALDRKRGRGPQVVRVERVVIHEGGQAIVGNVQPRVAPKAEEG
jgi:hypothetical protein